MKKRTAASANGYSSTGKKDSGRDADQHHAPYVTVVLTGSKGSTTRLWLNASAMYVPEFYVLFTLEKGAAGRMVLVFGGGQRERKIGNEKRVVEGKKKKVLL